MTPPPLLLYSLTEFSDLIRSCLVAAGVSRVLEIGSESGGFTRELLSFVGERDGELCCVEPLPTVELEELDASERRFRLIRGRSPGALAELEPFDAYLVDGDHNYWTVSRELEHIYRRDSGAPSLTILHDVSWPCARRDQYYAPEALPPEAVHPHSWELGSRPDSEQAVPGGVRGRGAFAIALREGGPRNGVLTAVEDFVEADAGLELARLPAVFGLGVVFATEAPFAGELRELLRPFDGNPLIERLERNRVDLYLKVVELQDSVSDLGLRQGRLLAEYDRSLTEAETESAALRLELARLREAAH